MRDAGRLVAVVFLLAMSLPAPPALARTVKVASIQFHSLDYAFETNLQRASSLLREAADRHTEIALLPEFALIGYDLSPKLWEAAETRNGRTVAAVTTLSRELGLYIGTSFLEVEREDFYNTFFLAAPDGSVAGWVRKQMPAGAEGYFFRGFVNEHVIDTALGRIGVGICQENYRCFLPRELREKRADLLLMPYSYPDLSSAGGLMSPSGAHVGGWYARNLAIPVVTSNKTGVWPQVEGAYFPGASAIVSQGGTVVAELADDPGVIVAEVDLPTGDRPALEVDCIGAFLSDLTLGSWLERRLTWASIVLADWLGTSPDDEIALHYSRSAERVAAAREHWRSAEGPAGTR